MACRDARGEKRGVGSRRRRSQKQRPMSHVPQSTLPNGPGIAAFPGVIENQEPRKPRKRHRLVVLAAEVVVGPVGQRLGQDCGMGEASPRGTRYEHGGYQYRRGRHGTPQQRGP